MLAGVIVFGFWAFLVWVWQVNQRQRIGPTTERRQTLDRPNRW